MIFFLLGVIQVIIKLVNNCYVLYGWHLIEKNMEN